MAECAEPLMMIKSNNFKFAGFDEDSCTANSAQKMSYKAVACAAPQRMSNAAPKMNYS